MAATPSEEIPVPILGPDIIDPRHAEVLRKEAQRNRVTPTVAQSIAERTPSESA